jgi:hypothetical protein
MDSKSLSLVSSIGFRDSVSLYLVSSKGVMDSVGLHLVFAKEIRDSSQPLWSLQEGLGTLSASVVSARGIRDSLSLCGLCKRD